VADLVSMKIDPKAREAKYAETAMADRPEYPWGLCLNVDDDALEKLGIAKLPGAGDELTLQAVVKVTSSSETDTAAGKNRSLSLQITSMGLEPKKAGKNTTAKLYGEEK
jgi:hypothetical protein